MSRLELAALYGILFLFVVNSYENAENYPLKDYVSPVVDIIIHVVAALFGLFYFAFYAASWAIAVVRQLTGGKEQ